MLKFLEKNNIIILHMNLLKTAFNVAMFVFGIAVMFTIFQLIFTYVEIFKTTIDLSDSKKKWKKNKQESQKYTGGVFQLTTGKKLNSATLSRMQSNLKRQRGTLNEKQLKLIYNNLKWVPVNLNNIQAHKPKNVSVKDWTFEETDEEGNVIKPSQRDEQQTKGKDMKMKWSFGKGLILSSNKKMPKKPLKLMQSLQKNLGGEKILSLIASLLNKNQQRGKGPVAGSSSVRYMQTGKNSMGQALCEGDKSKVNISECNKDGVVCYVNRTRKGLCRGNPM